MWTVLTFLTTECTTRHIAQVVYDNVKLDECMKTQGNALCDPDK